MSCKLTSGLGNPCEYSASGLNSLYITNFSDVVSITDSDSDNILDTVNFGTSGGKFHLFEFADNTANFTEVMSIGGYGNKSFTQTLIFSTANSTQEATDVMETLGLSKVLAIAVNKSGKRNVLFLNNAGEVTAMQKESGAAANDNAGFTVTLTAVAVGYAPEFSSTATIAV
jgi:hypothetical protein